MDKVFRVARQLSREVGYQVYIVLDTVTGTYHAVLTPPKRGKINLIPAVLIGEVRAGCNKQFALPKD